MATHHIVSYVDDNHGNRHAVLWHNTHEAVLFLSQVNEQDPDATFTTVDMPCPEEPVVTVIGDHDHHMRTGVVTFDDIELESCEEVARREADRARNRPV